MYIGLNWHPIYLSYETWMIICGVCPYWHP